MLKELRMSSSCQLWNSRKELQKHQYLEIIHGTGTSLCLDWPTFSRLPKRPFKRTCVLLNTRVDTVFFDLVFSSQQNNCHVLENTTFYPITFSLPVFNISVRKNKTYTWTASTSPLNDTVDHFKQIQTMYYIAKYAEKYAHSKGKSGALAWYIQSYLSYPTLFWLMFCWLPWSYLINYFSIFL